MEECVLLGWFFKSNKDHQLKKDFLVELFLFQINSLGSTFYKFNLKTLLN